MVLKEYLLRGAVKTALVLAPASIVAQWRAELETKFGIAAGGTDDPAFANDPDGYLDRHPILVASLALARRPGQRERFAARRYDLSIVDEAHRIKDHRTESYKLVNRLQSRFLLLLTATPEPAATARAPAAMSCMRANSMSRRATPAARSDAL